MQPSNRPPFIALVAAFAFGLAAPLASAQWQTFPAPWPLVGTYFGADTHAFVVVRNPAGAQPILFAGGGLASGGLGGLATGGLFRSSDDGRTWAPVALRLEDGMAATTSSRNVWAGTLPSLAASPTEPDELYVSISIAGDALGTDRCDLLRSGDLGSTWSVVVRNTPACVITHDPSAAHPLYGVEIGYGAAFVGSVWRSRDRGASWQRTNYRQGPLTLHIASDGTLYAAAGVVHVSTDQGESWSMLGSDANPFGGPHEPSAGDVTTWRDAASGVTHVLVATSDGLYQSSDGGQSWAAAGMQGFVVGKLDPVPSGASGAPKVRVGYGETSRGLDHAGLALSQEGAPLLPFTRGLPPTDGVFLAKAGRYALSNAMLSICTDTASCVGGPLPAISTLIEFHNAPLDHYFMTADSAEAAGIDRGDAGPGWTRTGQSFEVYANLQATSRLATSACRFYGTPGLGPNSHFFSVDPDECALVAADPGWLLESPSAFAALRPQRACAVVDGVLNCAPACERSKVVYRLYNGGYPSRDSNHRYVSDPALYEATLAKGWIGESARLCTAR